MQMEEGKTMYFAMEQKAAGHPALQIDTGEIITYGELREQIAEFEHAVRRRSFVFLLCENTPGAVIGYLGCLNAGAVPLLLSAQMDRQLLQEMYERYQPEYVWMPGGSADTWKPKGFDSDKSYDTDDRTEKTRHADAVALHVPDSGKTDEETLHLPDFGKTCAACLEQYSYQLYETGAKPCDMHPDLALLLATSGSTGSPKLVRLSRRNLESNASAIMEYLHLTETERPITSLPMQYTYGLSVLNSHFQAGACVLLTTHSVVQQEFWQFFQTAGGTSLAGVPYTYELFRRLHLFEEKKGKPEETPWYQNLRYLTQAGGRLSEALQEKIGVWAKAHDIDFIVMYGQTEATARMSYLPPKRCLDKIGSIGVTIPGGRFHLEDVDTATGVGELIYEGPNVTLGMAECRADLQKGDERRGVLHTGDLAKMDADGFYYIAGRKKRFLKIFGIRVGLDECERILQREYEDRDCEFACVGTDDHLKIYTTDEGVAESAAGLLADRLHVSGRAIQAFYIPEIPKNAAGKILYRQMP